MDVLYNVKYFKYPSGWQVRLYSTIVGIKDNSPDILYQDIVYENLLWIEEDEEWESVPTKKPNIDTWFNPFTEREEKMPVEYDEKLIERKKKRSIASSMGRTINTVYQKARANDWDWFLTFTFDPDIVDSMDYQTVVKKLSKWLNNAKITCPEMGYIVVPEKHKSGRYHFHGLFRKCDALGFIPSG